MCVSRPFCQRRRAVLECGERRIPRFPPVSISEIRQGWGREVRDAKKRREGKIKKNKDGQRGVFAY